MKKLYTLIFTIFILNIVSRSQESSLLDQARNFDVKLKTEDALKLYDQALEVDPKNVTILVRCAELNAFLGNAQKEPSQKMPFYDKAKIYANKAFFADSTSSLSNYSMALVLGCLINFAQLKEKGPMSRQLYDYASKSLKADSNYAKAIHLLANWNNEISSLNPAAKTALKFFFKDLPKASQEEAIHLYEKARKLDPSMISNNFHLSEIYKKIGRADLSIEILNSTIRLAPKSIEDVSYKIKAKELLESLK
jgi:tetratricopeptide (TPR) repeat protein